LIIYRSLVALAAGVIFGFGLAWSGMMDPARVQGFLDVSGDWSASLAFVLAGAVMVAALGTFVARKMSRPALASTFDLPTKTRIDTPLVIGSAIFGLGWGLAGFCPGPAVASLSLGVPQVGIFVLAMVGGIIAHDRLMRGVQR
jgi:uncharacterized membrane protein YedE/YeeE